jgi:hypothetical protein
MTATVDTVTSSAVATGDLAAIRAREGALPALFQRDRARAHADPALEQALAEVVNTPTIGAIAAIALARVSSGWSVEIGVGNGLARFQAFAGALVSAGWFTEGPPLASTPLPDFSLADPAASLEAMVAAAYPELTRADQRRVCQALIRSLAHNLGPDGVPAEVGAVSDAGLPGKTEVLERRVTTVASNVLAAGNAPVYTMTWTTETFERTKQGKDHPTTHRTRQTTGHRLAFNLPRWRDGDRSALLDYYRYVDDWLSDFNSGTGRMRRMPCFNALMKD